MKKYKVKKVNGKSIGEHRLVMQKHLRRKLFPQEIVHHIDGDKSNNRIDNLILFPTKKAHSKYHYDNGDLKLMAGGNRKQTFKGILQCRVCHNWKGLREFLTDSKHHLGVRNICKDCYNLQRKERRLRSET